MENSLNLKVDFDNKTFNVENNADFYYANFFVHVFGKTARQQEINFSYAVKEASTLIFHNDSPKIVSYWNGVSFADQIVNLIPNTNYVVECVINDFEFVFDFTTPYPPKPFDSWIWNESSLMWEASVEYPDDGGVYTWDEETTSWLAIDAS